MMQTRSRLAIQGIITMIASYLSVSSSIAELPPIRLWGYVGYDFRYERSDQDDTRMVHGSNLQLNSSTYLWQPWFAQVDGGVGFRLTETDQDSGSRSGFFVSGDARLRLFPLSRFPFEAFFKRQEDTVDGEFGGTDTTLTRYGVSQSYAFENGPNLRFRYEHNKRESNRDDEKQPKSEVADIAQVSASKNFDRLSLNLDSTYHRQEEQNLDDSRTRFYNVLRHRYNPSSTLSGSGQIAYREEEFDLDGTWRRNERIEFTDSVFWRPETDKPLLVTGALRYLDFTTETDSDQNNQTGLTATLGASYELTPHWQILGLASLTLTESETEQTTSSAQNLEVRYDSDNFELGEFDYNWFGSLIARNELDDDESSNIQSVGMDFGHAVTRIFLPLPDAPLRFRFNQSISALADNAGRSTQTLNHDLDLSWNRQNNTASTFVGLTLSDSRTFGGGGRQGNEEREFQFINLQFSRNQRLSRSSSWSGNVTLQASRQVSQASADDDTDLEPSANIELSYQNRQMFGVPRLRFRSTLRLFSDSYLPLLDEVDEFDEREGQEWENRFEYRIGRLDLSLLARVSRVDERESGLVYFQLRRNFDALY